MAITAYEEACTEMTKIPKILIINDFATPSSSFSFLNLSAIFRDNIRFFLLDYSLKEDYTIDGDDNTVVYCIFLASQATGVVFPLLVVEQYISSSSPIPLCDSCRCVGWGHHYVSKRKYHLIIPKSDEWKKPLTNLSLKLSSSSHHLLHGLIHCNGFGHLLCINTTSSDHLSGDQIMEFWDLLCSTLRTRAISLDDISSKRSMDLRLLHGVAYGRPWFGKWGYVFSHGSFGVNEEQYSRALHILGSLEIDRVKEDFCGTRKERVMKMIISFYRDSSETPLVTLSDLLQFMLAFGSKAPIERKTAMWTLCSVSNPKLGNDDDDDENIEVNSHFFSFPDEQESIESDRDSCLDDNDDDGTMIMDMDIKPPLYDSFDAFAKGENSRWLGKRLSEAAQAVLKVFAERNSIITRQDLREAVRSSIGDTGLIDFLLKHIDKVLIGDQVVQRFTDRKTRMLQFSLRSINPRALLVHRESKKRRKPKPRDQTDIEWTSTAPGLHPYKDVFYLYQNLLLSYPDSGLYSDASEVILNCKSFVKEWPLPSFQEQNPLAVVSFQVRPNHEEFLRDFTRKLPPLELVVVPQNATIKELKTAIEKALRDSYCVTETFEVLEIKNRDLEKMDDTSRLKPEGDKIQTEYVVTGFGLDTCTELRYEGGFDDWIVDCKCGARDDDGERMVSCDNCKVWNHTLCNSIQDEEAVPSVFLCNRCFGDSLKPKKRTR